VNPRAALRIKDLAIWLLLAVGGVLTIVPFLWMIATALKAPGTEFDLPIRLIPDPLVWRNFPDAWQAVPFGRFFINSIVVAGLTALGQLVTGSMAGYAFARLRFPARDALFLLYLGTMMIPPQVLLIPLFVLIRLLGWFNTFEALIMPGLFSAFAVFIMRQFFLTVPEELEDAAIVDGANHWQIFFRVMLPLAGPSLATLATFAFLSAWNSFLWPLVATNTLEMRPVTVGLAVFRDNFSTQWTLLMAGTVIATLPVIIVFLVGQRFFVRGITMTGIK